MSDPSSILMARSFLLTFSIFNVPWNWIDQGALIRCRKNVEGW